MTSNNAQPRLAAPIAAICVLAAIVVSLQVARDRRPQPADSNDPLLYVQSPAVATRLALSFKAVAADLYWLRVVQYYGSTRLSHDEHRNFDLLYPLLDLTTSLDPQFAIAYRFGAFFLTEHPPGGPGRPELATRLLDKAIAANPDRWEYPYDIGFIHYREGDYPRAAEWFTRAAAVHGAPNWLAPLAAVTLATGGHTDASRVMWRQLQATADEPWLRKMAAFRLQQLDTIDFVGAVQRVVDAYTRAHGAAPADWNELIRDGRLRGVPLDSTGHPLVLVSDDGGVSVGRDSPLWPLPNEKPR